MPKAQPPHRILPLAVVILAAGQGKRMKSELPKVLQPLAGKPLLRHVIDTARSLNPASIHVVYGHGGDHVREALRAEALDWVLQEQRLGTGHAVQQAMPHIGDDRTVLVLYGDVPLTRGETLAELIALAGPKSVALLTMLPEDPAGYGRIVRSPRGDVRRIIEEKDASKKELKLRECNSGILAASAKLLKKWLKGLKNDNSQGEYYLTDVIAMASKDKVTVTPLVARDISEVLGVNDKTQLAELEGVYRRRVGRDLMLAGVTLADPSRIDVRGQRQTREPREGAREYRHSRQ
jgi:bifunctional UDP-N-acetylglucosamine pyrophosphorylase/glucosamine-1-phosphate N-acetyltransferase